MSSRAWEGHAELREALQGLACAKGTSATRVKAVANAAFKYVKDYKRVVHDVEMFLWKADVEHRLAGLYAVDAIIRQSQLKFGAKDQFTKRFALHLTNTITAVKGIPADAQQHVRHVVQEWQTRGFYTASQVEDAGGQRYSISGSAQPPPQDAPQRDETTPKAASGKLATLLSIIKKQKERNDQQQQVDAAAPSSGGNAQQHQLNAPPSLLGSPPRSARILSQPSQPTPRLGSPQRPGGVLSTPLPHQQQQPYQQRSSSTMDADFQRMHPYELDDRKRGVNDALLPDPLASGVRMPPREHSDDWYDARNAKKQRGSRWGPPKPTTTGGDELRPPPIMTTTTAIPARHDERGAPRYAGDSGAPMHSPGQYPPMRANGWQSPHQQQQGEVVAPPDAMHQPPPNARGGGFGAAEREPFHDAKRFAQAPPHAFGPPSGVRLDGSRAMGSPRRHGAGASSAPGDRIPGSSGELCRNFVFGRCTYGDQCWHRHDEKEATNLRLHPEVLEMRRKTVLCTNFPRGMCRFGDRCSYAHSEQELERAMQRMRSDGRSSGDAGSTGSAHGAYSPRHSTPPLSAPTTSATPTMTATAPAQLNRPNGSGPPPHPALYNEVQGDRGKSGARSMSPHGEPSAPVAASGPPFQPPPSASSLQDRAGAPPRQVGAEAGAGAGAGAAMSSSSAPHVGAPGLQPQPPLGVFPPRGFSGMPPPRPPPAGMMGPPPPRPPPPGMMGLPPPAMMGPPPPRAALGYPPQAPPPQSSLQAPARHPAPTPVETRPGASSVDAAGATSNHDDDDDDVESAAPEFTLQYDDDD